MKPEFSSEDSLFLLSEWWFLSSQLRIAPDIATEIAVIRVAGISNCLRFGSEIAGKIIWASKSDSNDPKEAKTL